MSNSSLIEQIMRAAMTADESAQSMALAALLNKAPEPAVPERLETLTGISKATGLSTTLLWRAQIPAAVVIGSRKRYKLRSVLAYFETQEFKDRMQQLSDERKAGRKTNSKTNI